MFCYFHNYLNAGGETYENSEHDRGHTYPFAPRGKSVDQGGRDTPLRGLYTSSHRTGGRIFAPFWAVEA